MYLLGGPIIIGPGPVHGLTYLFLFLQPAKPQLRWIFVVRPWTLAATHGALIWHLQLGLCPLAVGFLGFCFLGLGLWVLDLMLMWIWPPLIDRWPYKF